LPARAAGAEAGGFDAAAALLPATARPAPTAVLAAPASSERRDREVWFDMMGPFRRDENLRGRRAGPSVVSAAAHRPR
jgi:hypothetical protein